MLGVFVTLVYLEEVELVCFVVSRSGNVEVEIVVVRLLIFKFENICCVFVADHPIADDLTFITEVFIWVDKVVGNEVVFGEDW